MCGCVQEEVGYRVEHSGDTGCSCERTVRTVQYARTAHDWTLYYWHQLRYEFSPCLLFSCWLVTLQAIASDPCCRASFLWLCLPAACGVARHVAYQIFSVCLKYLEELVGRG